MLTRNETWMLGAAWAAIAGLGLAGASKVRQIPAVEPEVIRLEQRFEKERTARSGPVPGDDTSRRWREGQSWLAEGRKAPPLAAMFAPEVIEKTTPPGVREIPVLPSAAAVTAAGDLDGVLVRWSLVDAPLSLEPHERRVKATPAALRIERREPSGEFRPVATLDAKATSWRDAEAAPGRSWEYRVVVEGDPKARRVETPARATAATPDHRRTRLVGGDASVALVRVETYDRGTKAWSGREAPVRTGTELWTGGPRLARLWFAGFELKAELAWPDGRSTELDR